MLLAFEAAEREAGRGAARSAWLTFVVVGGGPTGVELAGALAEIARAYAGARLPPHRPAQARVILLEGGPRVLPAFAATLSAQARGAARSARRRGPDRARR